MDRTPIFFIALALSTTLAASTAFADRNPKDALDEYRVDALRMRSDPNDALSEKLTATDCAAWLEKGKQAGSEFAPDVCDKWMTARQIAQASHALSDAQTWNRWLTEIDIADNSEENQDKMVASADNCVAEMDRLLAAGLPTDVTVKVGSGQYVAVKLGEAKDKVCAPLVKAAKTFAKDVASARAKRDAEIAAPYKKAGITGDRLELCVHYNNAAIQGIGGGELTTPAQLKNASIMFVTLGPASDTGLWMVTRYVYKGDKQISRTTKQYILQPGSSAYR